MNKSTGLIPTFAALIDAGQGEKFTCTGGRNIKQVAFFTQECDRIRTRGYTTDTNFFSVEKATAGYQIGPNPFLESHDPHAVPLTAFTLVHGHNLYCLCAQCTSRYRFCRHTLVLQLGEKVFYSSI